MLSWIYKAALMRCHRHLSHCSSNFGSDSVAFTSSQNCVMLQERTQTERCGIKNPPTWPGPQCPNSFFTCTTRHSYSSIYQWGPVVAGKAIDPECISTAQPENTQHFSENRPYFRFNTWAWKLRADYGTFQFINRRYLCAWVHILVLHPGLKREGISLTVQ